MNSTYKPEGYNSLSAYLIVDGAERLIELLEKIFDAEVTRRYDAPNGIGIMHAEVRIDDTILMLADSTDKFPPVPSVLHVYVSDSDEVYRRAIAAGCKGIQEPIQKGDPDKRGTFEDFAGNSWSVSTQLRD